MGFALWVGAETAWAQGTYEYRPMGSAVIGARGVFTPRDFQRRRTALPRDDPRFTGHFASLGQMNDFLARFRRRSQARQKKIREWKSLGAPYF
ncbi:MAG: hypothetical protein ABSC08_11090 [Bryobacteraceae bacterium]